MVDPVVNTPLLTETEVISLLRNARPEGSDEWRAMYSSVFGGVVLDPKLFIVPIDDHMVHRGHCVFDTCNVTRGAAYGLSFHLDRLLLSAAQAMIFHPFSKAQLREIILRTLAAAGKREGVFVRYWLTAGRGDFHVSPEECTAANFYVVVHDSPAKLMTPCREFTVSVPLKPPLLAQIKSNNYLLNAMAAMQSEAKGGCLGIQVDSDGFVAEASIGAVMIVDRDAVLRTRDFDVILASTTAKRAFVLAPKLLEAGLLEGFEFAKYTVAEMEQASEVFLVGGGGIKPVSEVNGTVIADGRPGPVTLRLADLLKEDMTNPQLLDEIPFAMFDGKREAYRPEGLHHKQQARGSGTGGGGGGSSSSSNKDRRVSSRASHASHGGGGGGGGGVSGGGGEGISSGSSRKGRKGKEGKSPVKGPLAYARSQSELATVMTGASVALVVILGALRLVEKRRGGA